MEVIINLDKIQHNISAITKLCKSAGLQVVWVTKGCHSHPEIIRLLNEAGAEIIGEVYLKNFELIRQMFAKNLMMIQSPALSSVKEIISHVNINLISNFEQAEKISQALENTGKKQSVILMTDIGNLREGIMPECLMSAVKKIKVLPCINLEGLGASVGCYGGYVPECRDMQRFIKISKETQAVEKFNFNVLSVGSGTMLIDLVRAKKLPKEINQIRIGAAFLVGEKPPTKEKIIDLHHDAFQFCGEILELFKKPSVPASQTGYDAFGRQIIFEDLGIRDRALLDFGMVDTDIYDLSPLESGIKIIGGTSNYTICDVSECRKKINIGDCLEFRMGYSAMAKAMASPYVPKIIRE